MDLPIKPISLKKAYRKILKLNNKKSAEIDKSDAKVSKALPRNATTLSCVPFQYYEYHSKAQSA